MNYLGNAFSPAMLQGSTICEFSKLNFTEFATASKDANSVVSHDTTSALLTQKLNRKVEFHRVNLTLEDGDILYIFNPGLRFNEAREYSSKELEEAFGEKATYWEVKISK